MTQAVRVRFAPSPTGYLHVGGARTAIFNWLFARKHKGAFLLRIEDTDAERSTAGSVEGILEGLRGLGLKWDEGPYFQRDYLEDHIAAARKLVAEEKAYPCFCPADELDAEKEAARAEKRTWRYSGKCRCLSPEDREQKTAAGESHVIRLKLPEDDGAVRFTDAVYGEIEKRHTDLDDFIIVRSDGSPLYLLANAVDDIRDGITHIIRGQDGLGNTPRQVLIYEALGADLPVFAHMSLALDPSKAKISKRRHGEKVSVQYYLNNGFLPDALVNFLALLGWSPGDDRDFMSRDELIQAFDISGISRHNPIFDLRTDESGPVTDPKAISLNARHMRQMPLDDLAEAVGPYLESAGLYHPAFAAESRPWFLAALELLRTRFTLLTDFAVSGRPVFSGAVGPESNNPADWLPPGMTADAIRPAPELIPILTDLTERLEAESPDKVDAKRMEEICRESLGACPMKPGPFMKAVRLAVSGAEAGPGFTELLALLGTVRTARRLTCALRQAQDAPG